MVAPQIFLPVPVAGTRPENGPTSPSVRNRRCSTVTRQLSPTLLGRRLVDMGLKPVHTRNDSVYRIVKL